MPNESSIPLAQKLLFYGVSAGAATLAASTQAAVVSTYVPAASGDSIYFDPVAGTYSTTTAGTAPFTLTSSTTIVTGKSGQPIGTSTNSNANAATNFGIAQTSGYALKLSAGTMIGSNLAYSTSTIFGRPSGVGTDHFYPGTRAFIGLMLTVNGQTDYGWADVQFNGFPNSPVSSNNAGTVYGFAYENSGVAIAAGAGEVVPEPSTVALLVAGAAGAAAWRRRRTAASSSQQPA